MELTAEQIQKFSQINDKIRQEEIRARKTYFDLIPKLDEMVKEKIISNYEIDEHYSLYSYDENFCKTKNVEIGDPFHECEMGSSVQSDDEFFNTNWNEWNWFKAGPLKNLHFGYTMHCLMFHRPRVSIEDLLAADEFKYELLVRYQFITK